MSASRPLHLRPAAISLVLLGGSLGVAAREALILAVPDLSDVPWTILAINLVGAFLLGLLLDGLARRGPDAGARRSLRLLAGTGFMGGFTTYSTLAVGTAVLLGADGSGPDGAGIGLAYGLATVLLGALATMAGIALATFLHRHDAPPADPPAPPADPSPRPAADAPRGEGR